MLSAEQNERIRERSRIRVRVEHIFGSQHNEQGDKLVRTIGLARAGIKIGLMNLIYNFPRYVYMESRKTTASVAA